MSSIVEAMALAIWQEREKQFPERVRRMQPDRWDEVSGAWPMVMQEAEAAHAAYEAYNSTRTEKAA